MITLIRNLSQIATPTGRTAARGAAKITVGVDDRVIYRAAESLEQSGQERELLLIAELPALDDRCAGVGGTGDVLQGGNTFGAALDLGTNDNFALNLRTNGATRVPNSSIDFIIASWGTVPTLNCSSIRWCPKSPCWYTIFSATASGSPRTSEPRRSRIVSNCARVMGGQPRSAPMRDISCRYGP